MAHFCDPDARRSALADLQMYVAGLMFSLKAVMYRRNAKQVHAMFDSTGGDATKARDDTQDFWRYGLTTITHFRIDALFQMLLKARGEYKNNSAFTVMLKQVLDVCELKDR